MEIKDGFFLVPRHRVGPKRAPMVFLTQFLARKGSCPMARDHLFGELAAFRCDVAAVRRYYEACVEPTPSTPYFDNGANYVGWAVTSRDGTVHDGIKQIPVDPAKRKPGELPGRMAVKPTPLCDGPVRQLMDNLALLGLRTCRARFMALPDQDFTMTWHADAKTESWRLHIPVITNPGAFFEWKFGNQVIRRHLPADGRAWFVRVDPQHRAVNQQRGAGTRVHLLMSLIENPAPRRFGPDFVAIPAPSVAGTP